VVLERSTQIFLLGIVSSGMKRDGSITVSLTLIFIVIMSLITAVIENTRVLSSDAYVSVAANSAAEMVMGQYNKELYDEYKLFGYGGYNGMGEIDINEEFMEFLKDNLTVCPPDPYKSYSNIYRLSDIDSEIIRCMKISEGEYLDEQISEYLKLSVIDDIKDSLSGKDRASNKDIDTGALNVTDDYENGKYDDKDNIKDSTTGKDKKDDGGKNTKKDGGADKEKNELAKDSAGGNPLKSLKDIVKNGILSLVCDESKVSSGQIVPRTEGEGTDKKETVRKKFSAGGYLSGYIDDNKCSDADVPEQKGSLSSGTSKVRYITYAKNMFSSYINNLNKTVDYGREYMAAGKLSEKDNLLYVVNRLMVMRMGINFAYIMSDAVLQEKALATATVIAGVTGLPPVITAVKYTILTILAYEESCVDVCALLQKKSIPMIKKAENFKMTYEEICLGSGKLFRQKAMQYSDAAKGKIDGGFTYEKGIVLLQMLVPADIMKERILDIIQYDMRERFQATFCIDTCICFAEYKVTYDIPFAYSYLHKYSDGGMVTKREVKTVYEYKS